MKAPGNLLIGFSGGLGSTVLLDLISKVYFSPGMETKLRGGTDHPRNTSVWNEATVCYVEICSAFPGVRSQVSLYGHF
jgi:cytoplasmic tRNA 2-thiolation protein 2